MTHQKSIVISTMKHRQSRTAFAAVFLLAVMHHANAEFDEDVREFTSDVVNSIKNAVKAGKAPDVKFNKPSNPYLPLVGNWFDRSATITSMSDDPARQKYNYQWSGQIIGRVTPLGEYIFRANNGCEITGVSMPFASNSMWSMTTTTRNCPFEYMNTTMAGRISKDGNVVTLTLQDPPLVMGRQQAFTLRAVMRSY